MTSHRNTSHRSHDSMARAEKRTETKGAALRAQRESHSHGRLIVNKGAKNIQPGKSLQKTILGKLDSHMQE